MSSPFIRFNSPFLPVDSPFPRVISPLPSVRIEQNNTNACTRHMSLDSHFVEVMLRSSAGGLVLGEHVNINDMCEQSGVCSSQTVEC